MTQYVMFLFGKVKSYPAFRKVEDYDKFFIEYNSSLIELVMQNLSKKERQKLVLQKKLTIKDERLEDFYRDIYRELKKVIITIEKPTTKELKKYSMQSIFLFEGIRYLTSRNDYFILVFYLNKFIESELLSSSAKITIKITELVPITINEKLSN